MRIPGLLLFCLSLTIFAGCTDTPISDDDREMANDAPANAVSPIELQAEYAAMIANAELSTAQLRTLVAQLDDAKMTALTEQQRRQFDRFAAARRVELDRIEHGVSIASREAIERRVAQYSGRDVDLAALRTRIDQRLAALRRQIATLAVDPDELRADDQRFNDHAALRQAVADTQLRIRRMTRLQFASYPFDLLAVVRGDHAGSGLVDSWLVYQGAASRGGSPQLGLLTPPLPYRWSVNATTLRHAVPGRHLYQQAIGATEGTDNQIVLAPVEQAWLSYAQSLGETLEFYQDEPNAYGGLLAQLQFFARAQIALAQGFDDSGNERAIAGLVAGDGLSSQTLAVLRQQASEMPAAHIAAAAYRFALDDGREYVAQTLGVDFDVKAYHSMLFANGPLLLVTLERDIELYIQREQQLA